MNHVHTSVNVPTVTGAIETPIAITDAAGRTEEFRVRRMTMRTAGKLQHWLNRLPRPDAAREAAELCASLHPDVQKQFMTDAMARDRAWPPQVLFSVPEALNEFLSRDGGSDELLLRLLEQARPDLTESDLKRFVESADPQTFDRALNASLDMGRVSEITPTRNTLVLLDPNGLELLVRATATACGFTGEDEVLRGIVAGVTGMVDLFGSVIRLDVAPDAVGASLPKGEVRTPDKPPRSSRSTSGSPTKS